MIIVALDTAVCIKKKDEMLNVIQMIQNQKEKSREASRPDWYCMSIQSFILG